MTKDQYYSIKAVEEMTGLTQHTIRKWEERYNAVIPQRSEKNRRLYTSSDIERLKLLKTANDLGQNIGNAVNLDNEALISLVDSLDNRSTSSHDQDRLLDPQYHLNFCIHAVKKLNMKLLTSSLNYAGYMLSSKSLIEEVILPLLKTIGLLWKKSAIIVAHEHAATALIRSYLTNQINTIEIDERSPVLIVASTSGQRHEIGSLVAALTAINEGWNAIYLGSDLPAEDIVMVTKSLKAKAIALSLIYPDDHNETKSQLKLLSKELDNSVQMIIGGSASGSYKNELNFGNIHFLDNFDEYRVLLQYIKLKKN